MYKIYFTKSFAAKNLIPGILLEMKNVEMQTANCKTANCEKNTPQKFSGPFDRTE
jgi:hypothetical protein